MHLCRASAGRLLGAAAAEALLLLSVVRLSSEASCKRHTTHVLSGILLSYSVSRPERLGLRICSSCPDLTCLAANSSAVLHPSWLVCHAIAAAVCQLWMLCLADPEQAPCTLSHLLRAYLKTQNQQVSFFSELADTSIRLMHGTNYTSAEQPQASLSSFTCFPVRL